MSHLLGNCSGDIRSDGSPVGGCSRGHGQLVPVIGRISGATSLAHRWQHATMPWWFVAAEPVLDRIGTRIAELEKRALPKSALAKAVWYTSNQWQALRRYTEDGRLTIDNNVSERTLRHQAIGRKNSYDLLSTLTAHRVREWAQGPCCETSRRWRRAASPACIDGRSNSYSGIGYPRMKVRRTGCPRSGCCGRNTEFLTRVPFTAPATRALRSDRTRPLAPLRTRSATELAARSTT
jgi:hypothetical protein